MKDTFKAWKTSRELTLKFIEGCDLKQLNYVPNGFNNNIIWNFAHLLVAQQSLVYKGSGLSMNISEKWVKEYGPGSKPQSDVSLQELTQLKTEFLGVIDQTIDDYNKGVFTSYEPRTTGTGFYIANVVDAIHLNNYHEALHFGVMRSLKRLSES